MAVHTCTPEIAVYTANVGRYDKLRPPRCSHKKQERFVCFADVLPEVGGPWEVRLVKRHHRENVLEGKRFKCQPHVHLRSYGYTIWQDANIVLKASPRFFLQYLRGADVALFRHPDRRCAYREADVCRAYGLDKARRIQAQMGRYEAEGFPRNYGLFDCSFIVRRHTPEVNAMGELWFQEIRGGSRRDQLSFTYVLWKMGLKAAVIPGVRGKRNPYVVHHRHVGRRGVS